MGVWKKLSLAGLVCTCLLPVYGQQSDDNGDSGRRSSRSSRSRSGSRGETVDDRDRRREDRTRSRETNSRSSRRSSRESSADDKKEAEKKDSKTVEGKKPSSGSKGSTGGGGRPTVNIAFEIQADPETNIMYLEGVGDQPSLNISVLEDKKFVTRLALYNPKSSEFSQIDASIKYDPNVVRPVGVDDGAIRSNLDEPARVLVNENRGLLSMAADFKTSRTDSFLTIAKIQWEALEPVASSPIAFVNTENHPSGVFNDRGQNILHMRTDGTVESSAKAGLLDATVAIEPEQGTIDLSDISENPFSAVALATNISAGTAEGGIKLYLRPRKSSVEVGETFLVDVIYQNPKHADMDKVQLKLKFDPDVLQVIDTDEGNWISRGVNIYDGAYHQELPFDHHRKNLVLNNLGLIMYDMGFGSRTAVPEEGIIATIRFRAEAPAASTPVVFSASDDSDSDTAITFLGFNLIGTPGERQQAMNNAAVSISAN